MSSWDPLWLCPSFLIFYFIGLWYLFICMFIFKHLNIRGMFIDRWMDKDDVVYRMECYSAVIKNEFESVLMRWINLEHYHTEWSKSEREKQISYINTYIWNLGSWYWWISLQGSSGDADTENRLWTRGGRDVWTWDEWRELRGNIYYHMQNR